LADTATVAELVVVDDGGEGRERLFVGGVCRVEVTFWLVFFGVGVERGVTCDSPGR